MSTKFSIGQMNQLADALEKAGYEPEDVTRMRSELGLLTCFKKVLNGEFEMVEIPLLKRIGTVAIPATSEPFVAREKFKSEMNRDHTRFFRWFLSGEGKIEDPIGKKILRYDKLCKLSELGRPITEELGLVNVETSLSEMFFLMEKQASSELGTLLVDVGYNVFYIRDQKGILRVVIVYRHCGGWTITAEEIDDRDKYSQCRVFSRLAV